MEGRFIGLSGVIVEPYQLKLTKARLLALAVARNLVEYAFIVECRRLDGMEVIIFDAEIEVPQLRVHPIEEIERIAVIFQEADDSYPEVLALRSDFPLVSHLNLRESEFPRSLCLYDERYDDLKVRWTPHRFIARIREWLSLTAQGILHQDDQPLEPLLLACSGHVVLPHDLLVSQQEQLQDTLYIYAKGSGSGDLFFTAECEKPSNSNKAIAVTASVHLCKPQPHGIIRQKPKTLSELTDFVSTGGIDLISELRSRLRRWNEQPEKRDEVLNSNLIIILLLPKSRKGDVHTPESLEIRVFYCFEKISKIGEKLGVWSLFGKEIGTLIGGDMPQQADTIAVDLLNHSFHLNREIAAHLNGYPSSVDVSISAIGVGALGSPVVTNLFRAGFGKWTIIDHDRLMPHNLGRHVLNDHFVGYDKSAGMAFFLDSIIKRTDAVKAIPANVMAPGKHSDEVKDALKTSDVILDMSASVSVARFLSLDINSSARRVSLFMNPSGQDLVLLAEDKCRKSRLDQLEMQYYRAIAMNDDLSGHFEAVEGRRRYGQSCRDVTSTLPQDYIALHSAIGSRATREVTADPDAHLIIWRADALGNARRFELTPAVTIQVWRGDWQVCTDMHLLQKLQECRDSKLPKETGGVLLGSFDMERKIVYIIDTLPSPLDSEEWPTLYIRGTRGLRSAVDSISEKTDGMLEYIGEWHSHPRSCPPIPSQDDLKVFSWLTALMEKEGLPALMMIGGDEGFGCFVGEIQREPASALLK